MKIIPAAVLLLATTALATEYECKVTSKIDGERAYSAKALEEGRFSVRIRDDGGRASIDRCSFAASQNKVTCDTFDVDKVALDRVTKIRDGKPVAG